MMIYPFRQKYYVTFLFLVGLASLLSVECDKLEKCPPEVFVNDGDVKCRSKGTYIANVDGVRCQIEVDPSTDIVDCNKGEATWQAKAKPQDNENSGSISGRAMDGDGKCSRDGAGGGPAVTISENSASSGCHSYTIPICEAGKYELSIWTVGGSDATQDEDCYGIKINYIKVNRVTYLNLLNKRICPRTEVSNDFKVEKGMAELKISKYETIPLTKKGFKLDVCFSKCGNKDGSLKMDSVSLEKYSGGPAKHCEVEPEAGTTTTVGPGPTSTPAPPPPPPPSTNDKKCANYDRKRVALCVSYGCQYFPNGKEICGPGSTSCEAKSYSKCICSQKNCEYLAGTSCSPEPSRLAGKLTCRRPNTYYVYHPKQFCHNEKSSGNCQAATVHAVNLNGPEHTGNHGIKYIADKDAGWKDPHKVKHFVGYYCKKVTGVDPKDVKLYQSGLAGRGYNFDEKRRCFYFPVPLCQNGEYMLTIRTSENIHQKLNDRCTDVKINDVPVIVHMDAFAVGGNVRCGAAEVVVMFLAEGDDDTSPYAPRKLYLKGHPEPIPVTGGEMQLQFCYGLNCNKDNNFVANAFSLERLGSGTKDCKAAT